MDNIAQKSMNILIQQYTKARESGVRIRTKRKRLIVVLRGFTTYELVRIFEHCIIEDENLVEFC